MAGFAHPCLPCVRMALGKDGKDAPHPVREEDAREQQLVQICQAACLVRLSEDSVTEQQSHRANGQLHLQLIGKIANENDTPSYYILPVWY